MLKLSISYYRQTQYLPHLQLLVSAEENESTKQSIV